MKYILISIGAFIVSYLIIAFIQANINFNKWETPYREATILCWLLLSISSILFNLLHAAIKQSEN